LCSILEMMFDWLNKNAAAVQALASVFSVITTIVLLGITRQYVKLTQELARAAREQLKFQERTFVSEAAPLVTLVDVFLGSLKRLPTGESEGDQRRTVSVRKHSDITAKLFGLAFGRGDSLEASEEHI